MIDEWITSILLILGAAFMFLSAVGLLRFPDLYTRMHAATKASTMGILLIFASACVYLPSAPVIVKSILTVSYIFITTPVASHMIGRAGHMMKVPKWKHTHADDLEDETDDGKATANQQH